MFPFRRSRSCSDSGAFSLGRMLATATAAVTFALLPVRPASALYSESVLHDFCKWTNCADGKNPQSELVADSAGNLYGTATLGGKHGEGVVFKYVPSTGKYYTLHNFCAFTSCRDGSQPQGGVIVDTSGNLFGTASGGGKYGNGTIFELSHGSNGWPLTVVLAFCPNYDCTTTGGYPYGTLAYPGQTTGAPWDPRSGSALLVTRDGGAYGNGTVYALCKLCIGGGDIHNFNTAFEANPLLVSTDGTVYGTTHGGGTNYGGILYRMTFQGSAGWSFTLLHTFCSAINTCPNGQGPVGRLAMDSSGNLFGATYNGGANPCDGHGCGVVFKYTAGGTYSVLYNFCSRAACKDGNYPQASVILDSYNNLFGTTTAGGTAGVGTAFELVASDAWAEHVRYDFCSQPNCTDGSNPQSDLFLYGGEFYGTTHDGGAYQGGTVFSLTP